MSSHRSATEIEAVLLAELIGMFPDESEITSETPLHMLGLDSLRLFELFVLVEKQFGISLLDGPITKQSLENIAALSRHIAERLQG